MPIAATVIDMPTLPSRNRQHGFYREMARAEVDASRAWHLASSQLLQAFAARRDQVRDYLDSRDGRWLGESVTDELARGTPAGQAVSMAVTRLARLGRTPWPVRAPA